MNVVIVGCSRLGARLAGILDQRGHDVTIIDRDGSSFGRLPDAFGGVSIIGTGIDEDVLLSARCDRADLFIASTNGDNRSIMPAQLAKTAFGVERVMCRIYDPIRAKAFGKLGIITICPTVEIADRFLLAADLDRAAVVE